MTLRLICAVTALLFTLALPFGATYAASASSTNAGKLARSAAAGTRRSAGRVVRRKGRTKVTSKRASNKRSAGKRVAKRSVRKKRIRRVLRVGKASKTSRKLRKSKRRVASTKRRVRTGAKMAKVARGPVEPKLIKAAYQAKKSGKLLSRAPFKCIPDELKAVLGQVAERWGTVVVNSSHRSKAHNRRVGGKSRSFHLRCEAADFSVRGSHKGLVAFLRSHPLVGGYKRYRAGHFHIDVGPKRTW